MNAMNGELITTTPAMSKVLSGMRISSAYGLNLAVRLWTRMTELSAAIGRLVAGPPMSEQARYKQSLFEVETRRLDGLSGSWFRPH